MAITTKVLPFIYANPSLAQQTAHTLIRIHQLRPNLINGVSVKRGGDTPGSEVIIATEPTPLRTKAGGEPLFYCDYIVNDRVFGFFYTLRDGQLLLIDRNRVLNSPTFGKYLAKRGQLVMLPSSSVSLAKMLKWPAAVIKRWREAHPRSQLATKLQDAKPHPVADREEKQFARVKARAAGGALAKYPTLQHYQRKTLHSIKTLVQSLGITEQPEKVTAAVWDAHKKAVLAGQHGKEGTKIHQLVRAHLSAAPSAGAKTAPRFEAGLMTEPVMATAKR